MIFFVFLWFFFLVLKSVTAINTCLDEMEECKGRDIAVQVIDVLPFSN